MMSPTGSAITSSSRPPSYDKYAANGSGDRAPGEVADRGDFEPGAGARLATLGAARQSPPATEPGEGVLGLDQRPDRHEAANPGRRGLGHVRLELLALRQAHGLREPVQLAPEPLRE